MNEDDLITRYFKKATPRHDVLLGIGDDAALVQPPKKQLLVMTMDTLVEGIHFFPSPRISALELGHKALAVNLSDLAAMGAEPSWMLLALTIPEIDPTWLSAFAKGLFALASQYHLPLIGGDTTRGPLSITLQLSGIVPPGKQLSRSGAKVGDNIYVSGTLGDAGLGLKIACQPSPILLPTPAETYLLSRLNRPTPRIALGLALRDIASSAIDISDGLLTNLTHVLNSSGSVGATLIVDSLPLSTPLRETLPLLAAQQLALSAGDDYELCFTVPPKKQALLAVICDKTETLCTCIGQIEALPGIRFTGTYAKTLTDQMKTYPSFAGFSHF